MEQQRRRLNEREIKWGKYLQRAARDKGCHRLVEVEENKGNQLFTPCAATWASIAEIGSCLSGAFAEMILFLSSFLRHKWSLFHDIEYPLVNQVNDMTLLSCEVTEFFSFIITFLVNDRPLQHAPFDLFIDQARLFWNTSFPCVRMVILHQVSNSSLYNTILLWRH